MSQAPFPPFFQFGVSSCEYQNSGAGHCPNSQWAEWEKKKGHIEGNASSKDSYNHYTNTKRTLAQLQELGVGAYRFSVEWSKIEPQQGEICEEVLDHYSTFVDDLISIGVIPMITLHHFSHPIWFEELGGFTLKENTPYFVAFCKKVFERLSDRVLYWCTINEPGVFAYLGYNDGYFPPGIKGDIKLQVKVVETLLLAHIDVYDVLKGMPNGEKAKIGLVHQYLNFTTGKGIHKLLWWFGLKKRVWLFHQAIFDCFSKGKTSYPPFRHTIFDAKSEEEMVPISQKMDFIGVNYYTIPLAKFQLSKKIAVSTCNKDEYMTDMEFRAYPQGLYDALMNCHNELKIPIIVTESGIPDRKDDRRGKWITAHLAKLSEAIEDGANVRGFYYWTLNDNFEWHEGYTQKFGLYEVDFENQTHTLRDGAKEYMRLIKKKSPSQNGRVEKQV